MNKINDKKTIRIDFRFFWPSFNKYDNFFINLLNKKYNVVIDEENPDFVFFSIYGQEFKKVEQRRSTIRKFVGPMFDLAKKSPFWDYYKNSYFGIKHYKKKIPKLEGKFVKILYVYDNVIPDMTKCDWALSFCYEDEFKHPRNIRLPYYVLNTKKEELIKGKNYLKKIKKKTKFCNFIYSNDVYRRNKFFKLLSKYKRIDAPGKCMNNMPNFAQPPEILGEEGKSKAKKEFISDYKFTIAFENSVYPGYTTEKLVQPMAVGSIPIYFGNPEVHRDFNTKSFINVHEFKNFKEAIKKIIEIDQNERFYLKMLKEPWFKNNQPNTWYNEERLLKKFEEVFENKKS